MRLLTACGCCLISLLCTISVQGAEDVVFAEQVLPIVKKYCLDCHSGSEAESGLSFETARQLSHVDDHPDLWEEVAKKLRSHEMPPADHDQPTDEERNLVSDWIGGRMQKLLELQRPSPGRVTMRRLNRVEYNNTIRDLVGIEFRPAEDFPADDTGYGFDNIGDVLSLSPLLMEKYFSAAEQIVSKAIVESIRGEPIVEVAGKTMRHVEGNAGDARVVSYALYSQGLLETTVKIPASDQYEIVVDAYGDQAGSDPARMSVRVDGTEIKLVDVPAKEDRPGKYTVPWRLEEGEHSIGVAFVNDFYDPDSSDPAHRDRNLIVWRLQIYSTGEALWKTLPEAHRRIIHTAPDAGQLQSPC